ncbi:hypothetical protein Tco_0687712 [Tanacetum coccineum]
MECIIPNTLGWYLEEIHLTYAHLEKKRTRLRLHTKFFEETVHTEYGYGVTFLKRRHQDFQGDDVTNLAMTSERSRLKVALEDLTRRTIDQSADGKLRDRNTKESWALLEDLAPYDNESWNDLRDFAKPVKAISLPQDVLSTSDRRLIELENQVQRLMESHVAPKQPIQVNKISSLCEICNGPHDTQYCIENIEQAFVEYAFSRTDKVGGDDGDVMFIEIIKKYDDSRKEEHVVDENAEAGELEVEY